MHRILSALLLLVAALSPAGAVTITSEGVFSRDAPSDGFFTPGRQWRFRFDLVGAAEPYATLTPTALLVTVDSTEILSDSAMVMLFPGDAGGALALTLFSGARRHVFELYGPQLYDDNGLVTGRYRLIEGASTVRTVTDNGLDFNVDWIEPVAGSMLLQVGDAPAIPEPATWLLLVGGFGAVGTAMRRGRRVGVAA